LKKNSYYLVILIYLINNNYLENLIIKKNKLFNKFFLASPLVEIIKFIFTVLQLKENKHVLSNDWPEFCSELIYKTLVNLPNYKAISDGDINTSFYSEVY